MKKPRGFTLFEMVVVLAIIGILAATTSPMIYSVVRAYDATLNRAVTLDKLRYATERIARELRDASGGSSGSFATMSSTAVSVIRQECLYSGGSCTTITRTVTISLNSSAGTITLAYSTPAVSATLTDQVSTTGNGLSFVYYDSNGNVTSTAANVRYVEVSLTLTSAGQTYNQRTRVALRNA